MIKYIKYRLYEKILNKLIVKQDDTNGSIANGNQHINNMLKCGKPFSLIRPGLDEMATLCKWDEHRFFGTKGYLKLNTSKSYKGDNQCIGRFYDKYVETFRNSDFVAAYPNNEASNYLMRYCLPNCKKIDIRSILQINNPNSWMFSLKGKRVLIVSLFVETMKKQYAVLDKVWEKPPMPLDLDIVWLKAPWYSNNDVKNNAPDKWFDVYDELLEKVKSLDFDVAILCCSSFGTFLTAEIKKMGRSAIQFGGDFQLLFGIRGARWDDIPYFKALYNEYWVRPSSDETPQTAGKMEGGCYW